MFEAAFHEQSTLRCMQALLTVLYKRPAVLEGLQAEQEQRPAFIDLAAFMQWLWQLTVAPQNVCRRVAMRTMERMAALVHPASDAGEAFVTTTSGLCNAWSAGLGITVLACALPRVLK